MQIINSPHLRAACPDALTKKTEEKERARFSAALDETLRDTNDVERSYGERPRQSTADVPSKRDEPAVR